jgi:hypothetical protein
MATVTDDHVDARVSFEDRVHSLRGRRVLAVDYWDIRSSGSEPAEWDYGDWHHAVMGVGLTTDRGPVAVTWTSTFFPYGVEAFLEPIDRHLSLGESGSERVGPGAESRWNGFLGEPVRDATVSWDALTIGPAMTPGGEVVAPQHVDVPTALRLDFETGPVWFVAGIPQYPAMESVFIPGDEIMVVFASSKMRQMGYDDPRFVG